MNWVTMTRKSGKHSMQHTKPWTVISTLLGLISYIFHNLHHWRSNQWPQKAELKLYHWAINPQRAQALPNEVVTINVWPLNQMCLVGTFARFISHGNSIYNIWFLYLKMYIYFAAHEVKLTWMLNTNLVRHGIGGGHVLCRGQMYQQDTSD